MLEQHNIVKYENDIDESFAYCINLGVNPI